MESENSRRLRWYTYVGDFINTLKAFIGTNYQSLPFAFASSGLGFGLAGVLLVATLTDYCCQLLLSCKKRLIEQICSNTSAVEEDDVHSFREKLFNTLGYGDLGRRIFGLWCFHLIQFAVCFTQFSTCVSYFIFIGNTVFEMFPMSSVPSIQWSNMSVTPHDNHSGYFSDSYFTANGTNTTGQPFIMSTITSNSTAVSNLTTADWMTTVSSLSTVEMLSLAPANNLTFASITTSPDLRLIILFPLPIFLGTSLLRNVRYLAPMSFIAAIGLFLGIISVLGFIFADFYVGPFVWYRFSTLPLFFTQLISAYEGIGCVLPIHCSMVGSRQMLHHYIHANIYIVFFVLCAFGAFGYVRYGPAVPQLIVRAITQHTPMSLLVDATLVISVVFTFPLQCFPVIEILEGYILVEGNTCASNENSTNYDEVSTTELPNQHLVSEHESLLHDESVELSASHVAKMSFTPTVPGWKRNTLRITLIFIMAGLAVLLRNGYAYVAAFTGAVGCSLLAYILPCLLHLKIRGRDMPTCILVIDIMIIIFAVGSSLTGLVVIFLTVIRGKQPV